MSELIGADEKIGIKKEAVRGTAETTATYYVPRLEFECDYNADKINDEQGYARIEDSVGDRVVKEWTEGSLKFNLDDSIIGLFYLNLFGTCTTTPNTPESGVNTHVFTIQQGHQHQSLTLFKKDDIDDIKFPLMMLTSHDLECVPGEYATAAFGFRAKKQASATTTPSYTAKNLFASPDVVIKIAANLAGLTAASNIKAKSVKFSYNPNVEDSDILGSSEADDMLNKRVEITVEVELNKRDTTYSAIMQGTTYKAMRIEFTSPVVIGLASNPKLTIDLARCSFKKLSTSRGLNDIETETFEVKAHFSISDTKAITTTLINTVASY